jgi:hypothetical protein
MKFTAKYGADPQKTPGTYPCGVTNAFDLHTDVLLREGDVTVSLQGSGALFALNRQTQALDLLNH